MFLYVCDCGDAMRACRESVAMRCGETMPEPRIFPCWLVTFAVPSLGVWSRGGLQGRAIET